MRAFLLVLALALGALSAGCGPMRPSCSAATCTGCCDTSGMCQFGSSTQACGARGEACTQCSVAEVCSFGTCTTNVGGTTGGGSSAGGVAGGVAGGSAGGAAGGLAGGLAGGMGGGVAGGTSGGAAGGLGGGTALPGDGCAEAEALQLTGGLASVTATTTGYGDDSASAQCPSPGPDRYYRLTLATASDLSATLTPSASSFGALVLLGPSPTCQSAPESSCREGSTNGMTTTLNAPGLSAGTYFLVVKNLGSGNGAFTLSVSTSPASVPGDSCSSAVPLAFSGGTASASGSLSGAGNDRSGTSCTATTGADVVYSFAASAGQSFSATVAPTSPMSSWRPVLSLNGAGSCSGASEATCNAAASVGGSASLTSMPLAAGTYFLWVDSVSGAGTGSFSLTASLTGGTPGETCAAPIPLAFSAGVSTVSGSISGSSDHATTTCVPSNFSGGDLVYSFTASGTQTFWAQLFPTGFRGSLSLRGPGSVCATASELACATGLATGSQTALTSRVLAAGTYHLWVDAPTSSTGTFNLSTTLTSGPTAENCASPIALSFTNGTASVSGSTATATATSDRRSTVCGGDGPDRVYSFTVTGTRAALITIQALPPFTNPVVALTGPSTSCASAPEMTCLGGTGPSGSTISRTLNAGTYYVWVDTFGTTSTPGPYSLTVTLN